MWNLSWVIPATLATIMIWAVSAVANYEYGLTQGTADPVHILWFTVTTSLMNGYASLAVDVLKVALPATAVVAWVLRKRGAAIGIATMFLLCLGWSTQNSVGYVLSNHSRAVDGRGQTSEQWSALQKSIQEAQGALAMVPVHRPAGVVKAELQAARSDRKYMDSGSCTNPAGGKAINFCNGYRGLTSEEAAADSAAALAAKLSDLRGQLDKRKRVTDADPLGTAAAGALGWRADSVSAGRSVSFSLLVEVISAVGMALIWGTFFAALRDAKEKRLALQAQNVAQGPVAAVPVQAPETVSAVVEAVLDAPASVQEAPKPKTPSGGGKPKIKVMKVDLDTETITEVNDDDSDGKVVPFNDRAGRAELPSFASDVFEEAAPPTKRSREQRKHKAMGSSKEWLAECTERADGIVCPAEDAWTAYRTWCEAEGMKQLPRSKFHNTISAKVGSVSANGKRGYVGLVLLDLVEEKQRAVA